MEKLVRQENCLNIIMYPENVLIFRFKFKIFTPHLFASLQIRITKYSVSLCLLEYIRATIRPEGEFDMTTRAAGGTKSHPHLEMEE